MNVAFIPVRGGSKSIPLKNIKPICGKPLVYWTVKAACECKYIDTVYVATDSDKIKEVSLRFKEEDPLFHKLHVIGRSAESASDTASTESAMLEFADNYNFDNIVLVQAKRFNWMTDKDGIAHPINYDVFHRPRRQEFDGYLVENGAFYITSREDLMKTKNRISGRIRAAEMDEDSFFEIDEPSDWIIIEALMKKKGNK